MKRTILTTTLCLLFTTILIAQTKEIESLLSKAQKGDLQSQVTLSRTYYFGNQKVKRDYSKSFFWCKKASEQGEPKSQFLLSKLFFKGIGTDKDINKSFYWCNKSALQNDAEAMFFVGRMYLDGIGTEKDTKKALYFIERAYNFGNEDAMVYWQKNQLWKLEELTTND
ncbi:sel1 repeat family protein [Halosquirtibacter laminarini]|uniref:Sel1 repeat family protein n=1 Tax=Halosquirtibacter laminarini TaxID=3374600 RepID=A0AC61NLD4_9BACT|nr:sel1 repeat family protein [Prolixibacteraceae bacterium]